MDVGELRATHRFIQEVGVALALAPQEPIHSHGAHGVGYNYGHADDKDTYRHAEARGQLREEEQSVHAHTYIGL
jgi:hypothetical protein